MTKFFACLVATFIYTLMMVPATAFTLSGEAINKSTAYSDIFPWWQAATAERGDHIFGGCQAYAKVSEQEVSWSKCLLAVVTENRDKFPARFTRESDFYLWVGETYLLPVVPGQMDYSQTVVPTNLAAEQKAFFAETIKVLNDFDIQLSELKNVTLTESQVQAMIDEALRAVVVSPTDAGLADLQSALSAQLDRLAKLEDQVEGQARDIDGLDARVKTVEGQWPQLATGLKEKADQSAVVALTDRVSKLETKPALVGVDELGRRLTALEERPIYTDETVGQIVDTRLVNRVDNQGWLSALAGALAGLVILLLAWWLHWYRPDIKATKEILTDQGDRLVVLTSKVSATETNLAEQQVQLTNLHKQTADLSDRVQGFDETLGILVERDVENRYRAPRDLERLINELAVGQSVRLTTPVGQGAVFKKVDVVKDVDKNDRSILLVRGVRDGFNVIHPHQKNDQPFFALSQLFKLLDKAEKAGYIDGLKAVKVA